MNFGFRYLVNKQNKKVYVLLFFVLTRLIGFITIIRHTLDIVKEKTQKKR